MPKAPQIPLRLRLVSGFLVAILTTVLAAGVVGAWVIGASLSNQARDKVRLDLNSAWLIYRSALERLGDRVRIIALTPEINRIVAARPAALTSELDKLRRRERFDVLNLSEPSGRLLARSRPGAAAPAGEQIAFFPATLLSGQDVVTGTAVLSPGELEREGSDLAAGAAVSIWGGEATRRAGEPRTTTGLIHWAVAGVTGPRGELLGVLLAGKLLNRETQIVDAIRQTLYEGETPEGRQIGEATIFLGDVRIATNFAKGGQRALGSRADPAVRRAVLEAGQKRVGPADVAGERHIAAYEPLRDHAGRIVGMLGVGIPKGVFTPLREGAFFLFFGITLVGLVISVGISRFIARRLERPIRALVDAVRELGHGRLDCRVTPDPQVKEFAELGEGFNRMADAIKERDLRLKYRTQEQLGRSERLAMIGRLAAGVAHEINNPLGGIMLFSNLLLRKAPAEGQERQNLERICNEAKRCQKIVQGLLDFARHRELKKELIDLQDAIDRTLALVEGQAIFLNVQMVKDYQATGFKVNADVTQMEQVFLNLIVNAVEAMQGKGRLTVETRHRDGDVQVSISDTGSGISEEHMERLFEPFFTTKPVGHGTGLGLSVSRGIVESHQGSIWASSKIGEGTTFHLRLPLAKVAE